MGVLVILFLSDEFLDQVTLPPQRLLAYFLGRVRITAFLPFLAPHNGAFESQPQTNRDAVAKGCG